MSGIKQIKKNIKKRKQKEAQEKMSETVGLFGKLPDHCLACKLPYNKKSKKAALNWRVTVDTKEEVVKLYCPQCWAIAQQMIEELT